jgi:septum site-determining protein MinC
VKSAIAVRPQRSMRFRGRSFLAFVLTPALPITGWIAELDQWRKNSPDFFVGRPIILDLSGASLSQPGIFRLLAILRNRGIRVIGLEGIDTDGLDPALPTVLKGGRPTDEGAEPATAAAAESSPPAPQHHEPTSLLLEAPIRSGQSVIFPYGDVTVLGSVSSGAEVVAGGSIHIYGTLRGRALAGSMGNARARIFCSKNEAELISIDGYYRTAEEMDASFHSRPTQCWLQDRVLMLAVLD